MTNQTFIDEQLMNLSLDELKNILSQEKQKYYEKRKEDNEFKEKQKLIREIKKFRDIEDFSDIEEFRENIQKSLRKKTKS